MTDKTKTELVEQLNTVGQRVEQLDLQRGKDRRTADAFKESEERYRAVVEGSSEGILVADVQTKRFHFANPAICRMLGYSEEELLQMSVADLHPPDSLEHVLSEFEAQARGEKTLALSIPCVRKDGTVLYANINTAGILIEGRKFNFGFFTDITEHKQAEEALRQSEEKYRLHFENVSDVIFSLDTELRFLDVSPSVEKILGYRPDELIGKSFPESNLLAPDSLENALSVAMSVLAGQEISSVVFEFIAKDGSRTFGELSGVPIFRNGKISAITVVGRDITERKAAEELLKKAHGDLENRVAERTAQLEEANVHLQREIDQRRKTEQELRESEVKWRSLVENAPDYIQIVDRNLTIQYLNRTAEGFKMDDVVGKTTIYDYIAPEHFDRVRQAFEKVFHTGQPADFEVYSPAVDRWFASRAGAIQRDGEVVSAIVLSHDITERKQAEEQARQHLVELAHVSRVSTMGEMATGIAHELNQPLMAITGFADAAQQLLSAEKPAQAEAVCVMLSKIGEQAQRAGQIIRRMRSFIRKSETYHSTVEINQLVQEVVDLASADARLSKIRLSFNPGDSIPEVLADRIQIQQVVLNLLKNAFDAMSEQDHALRVVTIETSAADDQCVEIAVKDNGTGLSVEDAERIFEMFYTSKAEGMGMGLAICRSIIEAHSGRLWAQPNEDGGTTFRFTLPLGKSGVHDS